MKKFGLWIFLLALPFLLMLIVNTSQAPVPTAHLKEQCTRYCHDISCTHGKFLNEKSQKNKIGKTAKRLYQANIKFLKSKPLGLGYKEANLLLYVVFFPTLTALLLGNIIRLSGK